LASRSALFLLVFLAAAGGEEDTRQRFESRGDAEAIARITVECGGCDWQTAGSEAVVLAVTLDDRAPVHVPITRNGQSEHRVMLGAVAAGTHRVDVVEESNLTSPALRGTGAAAWSIEIEQIENGSAAHQAIALAPFVHARPDTVGKFNDVPLLMWYEIEPTERGRRYRYSVIFSNEDGGTPADRLMATWGRTTDIEYVYSVEVDGGGNILAEDMQGPEHEILPFKGKREGRHPLLWVATHNNMVLDRGDTTVRFAAAPTLTDLQDVSREKVMDDNPWTYEVMAKELAREGKIVPDAPTGQGTIPDLRRYVFLEGCGEAGNNALTMSISVDGKWYSSDRGVAQYRVVRNGCFRIAIPLPGNSAARDVDGIRVQAFARKDKPTATPSSFRRLNTMFALNERMAPGPRLAQWEGDAVLMPDGPPHEFRIR
jgi:hypothetical protein